MEIFIKANLIKFALDELTCWDNDESTMSSDYSPGWGHSTGHTAPHSQCCVPQLDCSYHQPRYHGTDHTNIWSGILKHWKNIISKSLSMCPSLHNTHLTQSRGPQPWHLIMQEKDQQEYICESLVHFSGFVFWWTLNKQQTTTDFYIYNKWSTSLNNS